MMRNMKTLKTLIFLSLITLCYSCELSNKPNLLISTDSLAVTKYGKMGFYSVFNYRYMRYNADSAILAFNLIEVDSAMRHYNKVHTQIDQQVVATSDCLPFEMEIPVPIVDDSIFYVTHICEVDTVSSFRDTLVYPDYVHKSEIINPIPDTDSIIIERIDSVVVVNATKIEDIL